MAEALVLIGLVANVFQFIEQGSKILSVSKEVYHSAQGTTQAVQDLRLLVEDIKYSTDKANKSASSFYSVDEIAIRDYATECGALAKELQMLLDKLTAKPGAKFKTIESLKVGFQGSLKKKDLEKLERRLRDLESKMRRRLSNLLDGKRYSSLAALIQGLDQTTKRMDLRFAVGFEQLGRDISTALADSQSQTKNLVALVVQFQNRAEATATYQRILTSLMFDELKQRYSDIEGTYSATSDWIFDPTRTTFAGWLESGSGIFWISGLAGSGKSTLMKYLCNQERTKQALTRWAAPAMPLIASFFFWHQGTRMQKSQQGLLQSLLFQILRTDQDLWTKVCPDHNGTESWTLGELSSAVERLFALNPVNTKIFFFVDGLDEYEGDEVEVIQVVKNLSKCPNIKLCISSRPWNAFRRAFGSSCPTIALEEYTMNDIKFYIQEELAGSESFLQSVKQDSRCHEIVEIIATRAQGVWLWVFLVVRSLKRDLQSEESYNHLRRRIDDVPPRLEDYFRRIWIHIDPIYRMETARTLLVMLQAEESNLGNFPLLGQHCLESELEREDYALVEEIKDSSKPQVLQEYEASFSRAEETAKTRINDRCKDLVLIRKTTGSFSANSWGSPDFSIYRHHLSFLHRTVRDFLRQNFYDTLTVDSRDFSPVKSLFKVFLSLFKRHPISLVTKEGNICRIFLDFWWLARQQKFDIEDKMIDELIRVSAARSECSWLWLLARHLPSPGPLVDENLSNISFAILMGLSGYVSRNWQSNTLRRFEALGISPLELALPLQTPYLQVLRNYLFDDPTRSKKEPLFADLETVMALLDLGCDLNFSPPQYQQSVGVEILETILRDYHEISADRGLATEEYLYQTIKILFGRKFRFSQDRPNGHHSPDALTRNNAESRLNDLFGMTKTRELMALCESPSQTADSD
ncbi:hypothetical protein V8E51_010913 [Hyaloscypha variabilis]